MERRQETMARIRADGPDIAVDSAEFAAARVKALEEPCVEHMVGNNRDGYKMICLEGDSKIGDHRLEWEMANGRPMRPGMMGLHHCDNPPCRNAAHIFEGDAKDNAIDAVVKSRGLGRPRVSDEHRLRVYTFKATDEEWDAIQHAAARAGMKAGAWIRWQLAKAVRRQARENGEARPAEEGGSDGKDRQTL